MRYKDKNGIEDLYKAQWYIKKMIKDFNFTDHLNE